MLTPQQWYSKARRRVSDIKGDINSGVLRMDRNALRNAQEDLKNATKAVKAEKAAARMAKRRNVDIYQGDKVIEALQQQLPVARSAGKLKRALQATGPPDKRFAASEEAQYGDMFRGDQEQLGELLPSSMRRKMEEDVIEVVPPSEHPFTDVYEPEELQMVVAEQRPLVAQGQQREIAADAEMDVSGIGAISSNVRLPSFTGDDEALQPFMVPQGKRERLAIEAPEQGSSEQMIIEAVNRIAHPIAIKGI